MHYADARRPVFFEGHGCKVEKHGGVVIKFGRRVTETERDALKLLEPLQLPIPRVLGFKHLPKDEVRLEMNYIEGEPLDKVWPTLSSPQKKDIAHQLRRILVAIRSLEPDSATIGSCNGGPVRDCRRISEYVGGPFADEQSFNEFVFDLVRTTPTGIRNALKKRLRTNHRVVFSHGDLCQHNIIVKDNQIKGLLDWEYSGWYPEYWEYIKFFDVILTTKTGESMLQTYSWIRMMTNWWTSRPFRVGNSLNCGLYLRTRVQSSFASSARSSILSTLSLHFSCFK